MEELPAESNFWQVQGFSLMWDKTLLAQLLLQQPPFSLREMLSWRKKGLPSNLVSNAVLVEGLQACLEVLGMEEDGNMFLSSIVRPFIRYWQGQWPGKALIFGLHCDSQQWNVNVETNFATLELQKELVIDVTRSLWSGAASDAIKIMVPVTEPVGKANKTTSPGGFYVRRYS